MMCLWNPFIRKTKIIPDPPPRSGISSSTEWVTLAFGFCPNANDFKVVRIMYYSLRKGEISKTVADVYSLTTNSWKTTYNINLIDFDYACESDALFLNGTASFKGLLIEKKDIILCYDTNKDITRLITLPESCHLKYHLYYSIQVYGESIALFTMSFSSSGFQSFDMWVLKERGTNMVCWEKKTSFYLPKIELFEWSALVW